MMSLFERKKKYKKKRESLAGDGDRSESRSWRAGTGVFSQSLTPAATNGCQPGISASPNTEISVVYLTENRRLPPPLIYHNGLPQKKTLHFGTLKTVTLFEGAFCLFVGISFLNKKREDKFPSEPLSEYKGRGFTLKENLLCEAEFAGRSVHLPKRMGQMNQLDKS